MTLRVWIFVLECGHIVDKLKVFNLKDYNAAYLFHCWFFIYAMIGIFIVETVCQSSVNLVVGQRHLERRN